MKRQTTRRRFIQEALYLLKIKEHMIYFYDMNFGKRASNRAASVEDFVRTEHDI